VKGVAEPKTITLWDHQNRAIDALLAGIRYTALGLGTGSGKTFFGPLWLTYVMGRDVAAGVGKGAEYIAMGPTYRMTQDMMVSNLLEHYSGTTWQGTYRRSDQLYELPTGGTIYFRSADKPEGVEGIHARGMWVDEPSWMKYLAWVIIQARTALHKAPVLFTGHPTNMAWYFTEIFGAWEAGDPDFLFIQGSSLANPKYSREEFEAARRRLPPWLFEMRYEGKFRKPAGLVYPTFGADLYCDPFKVENNVPTYVILDPGVFYGVLFLAYRDRTLYAFNEYYTEVVAGADVHAAAIKERLEGAVQGYYYDPSRKTDVENLKTYGLGPFRPANNAVMPGIESVTTAINEGRVKVMRGRCPNLMDQMWKYSFPTDPQTGDISKGNPLKKDDHLPDCLRYGIHTVEGGGGRKEVGVW